MAKFTFYQSMICSTLGLLLVAVAIMLFQRVMKKRGDWVVAVVYLVGIYRL